MNGAITQSFEEAQAQSDIDEDLLFQVIGDGKRHNCNILDFFQKKGKRSR